MEGTATLAFGALSGGTVTEPVSTLAPGAHTITAIYVGDTGNAGSTSSAVTQNVKANSSVVLTAAPLRITPPQQVTLTAKITPASATGRMQFVDGATKLGAPAAISGSVATLNTTLKEGSHKITAVYEGDANTNGSKSNTVTVTASAG